MAQSLPPVPHQSVLTERTSGLLVPVWAEWFTKLFNRVGGSLAPDSTDANGYQKLPSGIYLQWGVTASLGSGTTTAVSFPVAFPTACRQVIAGVRDNSGVATTATGQWGTGGYGTTGFSLYNRTSVALTFNWFAVGY